MHWQWTKGKPKLATISQSSDTLKLFAGYEQTPVALSRMEPTHTFRTLGVHISPSGSQSGQIAVLQQHTQQYLDPLKL
jgi:hypothetical protein